MHRKTGRRRVLAVFVVTLLAGAPAAAQELFEPSIHWAYASYFGTGWYTLNERRSAFVFRTAPRWSIGDSGFSEDGTRLVKYTLRLPLTIGASQLDFDDIPGTVDPGNLATLAAGISVDADVPVTERFSLRPNVEVGYGGVIGEQDRAWSYRASMRGRFLFEPESFDWALILDGGYVGYDSRVGSDDRFSFVSAAAEFAHAVGWFPREGQQTLFYWHVKYAEFPDRVRLDSGSGDSDFLDDYWEVGAGIGRKERPIRLGFLSFDRLGLAYSVSSSSELRGVKLLFRSQYEL